MVLLVPTPLRGVNHGLMRRYLPSVHTLSFYGLADSWNAVLCVLASHTNPCRFANVVFQCTRTYKHSICVASTS